MVVRPDFNLEDLIWKRDLVTLRDKLKNWSPSALARVIADLSTDDEMIVLRILPWELAADTFELLDLAGHERLLKAMGQEELALLLNSMPDDRTLLLGELPANITKQLLTQLNAEERAIAVTLLGYPERSIGRLMTPDYIAVKPTWSL